MSYITLKHHQIQLKKHYILFKYNYTTKVALKQYYNNNITFTNI